MNPASTTNIVKPPVPNPKTPALFRGLVTFCAFAVVLLGAGCKRDAASSGGESAGAPAASTTQSTGANKSAAPPAKTEVTDVPPKGPATVAEAARMLDLNTVPLLERASTEGAPQRSMAHLYYRAAGDVKSAYAFHQKQLLENRWKELSQSSVTDQYASGKFTRNTFHVSMTVSPGSKPGVVEIAIHNHGNVNLGKLPVPSNVKPVYVGPVTAMYETDQAATAIAETTRKLLKAQGWQPYGSAGDAVYLKQNAIKLTATVTAAPAQGGKTMITYLGEQMSADIPAPPDATELQYADDLRRLTFRSAAGLDAIVAHCKQALAEAGWKPTRDATFQQDGKDVLPFRNAEQDLLMLEIAAAAGGVSKVQLDYQSAADIAEMNRKLDVQAAAHKAKILEGMNKPTLVPIPSGATSVQVTKNEIKFSVAAGAAFRTAQDLRSRYDEATGWIADHVAMEGASGSMKLHRETQTLTITFADKGSGLSDFVITSTGVELEREGASSAQ